jgi:hypothetical protein
MLTIILSLGMVTGMTGKVAVAAAETMVAKTTALATAGTPTVGAGPLTTTKKVSRMTRMEVTPEQAVTIVHKNYGTDETEARSYAAKGLKFMYLDRLCLYSYMTGKPLNELYALYQQNSWERLRYKIGLTPEVLYKKKCAYNADRIAKRLGLDRKLAYKMMATDHYPMQFTVLSMLIGQKAGKDPLEVVEWRTHENKWEDVAAQAGLTRIQYQELKARKVAAFKK